MASNAGAQREPRERGEEAAAPSNIRIIQEVHGGEVMPPDGGIVHLENVQMEPLFPKGKLNTNLSVRVFGRAARSNGLPSDHTDLNRRHPGLEENFLKAVVFIKVLSTSFQPEMIENEATEDVERLPGVRESAGVVREKVGGVVFKFQGGFSKEQKRPGGHEVAISFPIIPNTLEGFPSVLGHGAIKKAVLRGFLGT